MRPTVALVSLDNLCFNYLGLRKKVQGAKVMAVVKADAYGHGMVKCVEALEKLGPEKPEYYGVALIEEAVELKKSGLTEAPVLSFAPFDTEDMDLYDKYSVMPTVCMEQHIREIEALTTDKKIIVHVNIDTGMGRLGFHYSEAADRVKELASLENVVIDGIYTHFSTSDEKDKSYALLQLERFGRIREELISAGYGNIIFHAANSGAIIDMPDAVFDMVRPGISLYGYYPSKETSGSVPLKPVMSLVTEVSTIKNFSKGESASYGRKFTAKEDTTAVTAPLGYADGINRALTNRIRCIINGEFYSQIGRVTMDRILFETGNSNINTGDKIILIGEDRGKIINAWDWCDILETIPYEITCNISKRVPRKYI